MAATVDRELGREVSDGPMRHVHSARSTRSDQPTGPVELRQGLIVDARNAGSAAARSRRVRSIWCSISTGLCAVAATGVVERSEHARAWCSTTTTGPWRARRAPRRAGVREIRGACSSRISPRQYESWRHEGVVFHASDAGAAVNALRAIDYRPDARVHTRASTHEQREQADRPT